MGAVTVGAEKKSDKCDLPLSKLNDKRVSSYNLFFRRVFDSKSGTGSRKHLPPIAVLELGAELKLFVYVVEKIYLNMYNNNNPYIN